MTGVAGALLLEDLLVVAGDFAAGFGAGGAGAAVGAVGGHEIVNGLAAFFRTDQHEVGGLGVFDGEGLGGHDLES